MIDRNKRVRFGLLAGTVLSAFVASPAFAQEQDPAGGAPGQGTPQQTGPLTEETVQETAAPEEAIVVTGTLIRNPNLLSSAPVAVIGEDEIDLQQANVAEELLRELPGAVPSIGSAVNNGNGGQSFVNLRGLGANRNIVLLDGRRIVPGNLAGVVDLNNIPLALIQRLDTLTGGASTTYGADAVAGVVNFITRQDFAGVDLNLGYQLTEEGDGSVFRGDLTIGANFDDGRGNAVLSVGYQDAEAVFQGDRDFSLFQIDSFNGANGGSGTTSPSRFTIPGLGNRQINPATGAFNTTAAFNPFNFNPLNIFQTPFERYNMYAAARYEVDEAVEVFTRGLFSQNLVSTIVAPSGAFALPVQLPLSNPFLPVAARNQICAAAAGTTTDFNPRIAGIQGLNPGNCAAAAAATDPNDPNFREFTTNLSRRLVEGGPRISEYKTQIFDFLAGVRGAINESLNYELFGSYGESENTQTLQGYSLNSRVRQSIFSTNTTTCLNDTNGCVPINFFGADGSISQAGLDFIQADSTTSQVATLGQVRGTVTGDLGFNIASEQSVSFAIGGEYREYSATQISDLLAQSGDLGGAGGAAPNIDGGYNVSEAFGELIVPIISDRPGFNELTVEGGVRYSEYSVDAPNNPSFDTFSYKVGGYYSPFEGIRFRGLYAVASRAPNIGELFSPQNTVLTNLGDDPCANLNDAGQPIPGRAAPTGALRDVCILQGAPASQIGQIPVPTSGQANVTGGGNPNLRPEDSESYSFGAVIQPSFIPGLSASIDYYNIKIEGFVGSPAPDDIISACFDAPSVTNPACSRANIGRDPLTGSLSGDPATTPGLFAALSNLGRAATDGIDLSINYTRDFGDVGLALSFFGNYTFSSIYQATPTSIERDCVGLYSENCGSLQPEYSFSQRTTLTFGSIDVSLLWRHISSFESENGGLFVGPVPALGGRQENFNTIDATSYFDLTTRFVVSDNFTFTFSVQNLLDEQPPIVGGSAGTTTYNSGNTFPSTYDALGRRYAVSARIRF